MTPDKPAGKLAAPLKLGPHDHGAIWLNAVWHLPRCDSYTIVQTRGGRRVGFSGRYTQARFPRQRRAVALQRHRKDVAGVNRYHPRHPFGPKPGHRCSHSTGPQATPGVVFLFFFFFFFSFFVAGVVFFFSSFLCGRCCLFFFLFFVLAGGRGGGGGAACGVWAPLPPFPPPRGGPLLVLSLRFFLFLALPLSRLFGGARCGGFFSFWGACHPSQGKECASPRDRDHIGRGQWGRGWASPSRPRRRRAVGLDQGGGVGFCQPARAYHLFNQARRAV